MRDGGVEGLGVFGGDDEAAGLVGGWTADYLGYLGAGVGGGDDGAAAGEHAGELGGHDEVGGSGSLGEEMDVGGVEEVVEAIEGLEGEQGYVGAVGDEGFELGAEGSVAAEEEVDAGVVSAKDCGEGGEEFEALLGSHVAGVEEDDFVFEVEFAAEGVGRGAGLRVDVRRCLPSWGRGWRGCGDAFGEGALDHLAGDAGDAGEGAGEEVFEARGRGRGWGLRRGGGRGRRRRLLRSPVREARRRRRWPGDEERDGGAEEGGLDGEDDVGLPEGWRSMTGRLPSMKEARCSDSLEAGGSGGDVEGGAVDDGLGGVLAGGVFGAVEGVAVVFADAPCGVVRGGGDDADFVASGGEPGGHLAGVFADAG